MTKYWLDEVNNEIYYSETQVEDYTEITREEALAITKPALSDEDTIIRNNNLAKSLVTTVMKSDITVNDNIFSLQGDLRSYLIQFVNSRTSEDGSQTYIWYDKDLVRVEVSLQDLRSLLRLYQERIISVLEQYNNWLETDRLTEFEYSEED